MKKFLILPVVVIILSLLWPIMSFAKPSNTLAYVTLQQDLRPDYAPAINIKNSGNDKLNGAAHYGNYFLQLIAGGLLYLAGPTAILIIAISGLRYVTSHGEQGEMDAAKKTLTYAVVGLIVIIFSYAIVQAIITAALCGIGQC